MKRGSLPRFQIDVVESGEIMPPMFADNIRKVAVTFQTEQAQFIELDQSQPLAAVIKDLCDRWNLSNPDDYALQFSLDARHDFVTERNRVEINNGNVFQLTLSPSKSAEDILGKLQSGSEASKEDALQQLSQIAPDSTFAQEFISQHGLQVIVDMIQGNTLAGEPLSFALKSFVELMDHGIVSWDLVEPQFIKIVATQTACQRGAMQSILQFALEILESIVLNSSDNYSRLEQEVTPVSLMPHLESSNPDIQKNAMALINALFLKADATKRKHVAAQLNERSIRHVILNKIIRHSSNIGAEMAHQLYVLQCLMFSMLEEKKLTKVDPNDQQAVTDITDLRRIAFDNDRDPHQQSMSRRQSHAEDYKKLGFTNTINPMSDFNQVPPGSLALSNMVYFARSKGEQYTKVVLENSYRNDDHDLPFARASIELTNMLCDILKVGETPSEEGDTYHTLFFTINDPFEEFYCQCIQLMNKTWKEMKAKRADFEKVLSVVREQITRSLRRSPTNMDKFKAHLGEFSYAKITQLWQQERLHKEEGESQAKPIVELREQLKPEIMELIKQQRLACLTEGACFLRPNTKNKKHKYQFVRLSSNHKMLHYGECEDEGLRIAYDHLTNKIPVVDIKQLFSGKECPFLREKKKLINMDYALSIICEHELPAPELNFIARSEEDFMIWTDGLNALLGNQMTSGQVQQDMETLLGMEIKLRLLDTEGIPIPDTPPPIPSEPKNYNFAYGL